MSNFKMHESVINGINEALDNGDIEPHDLIQIVRERGNAVTFWQIEDIINRGKDQFDITITPRQAKEILKNIDRKHDAEIGICWAVLDVHIEGYDFEAKENLFDVLDDDENVIQRFLTEQQIEEAYPNFLHEGRTVLLNDTGETRYPGRIDANFVPLRVENGVLLCYVKETLRGSEFVTHKVKEREGTLELYWGHYFTAFDKAIADFKNRQ